VNHDAANVNMIGSYGTWAAESAENRQRLLSCLDPAWEDLGSWRKAARQKFAELLAGPQVSGEVCSTVRVRRRHSLDDLEVEELAWQLPYGPETEAVFLKPAATAGPLPGVLALHDHASVKYFGKRKIVRTTAKLHPFIRDHQNLYYGGVPWANALARRGYGVLAHDVLPFESRKIRACELPGHVVERMMAAPAEVQELSPEDLEKAYTVRNYEVNDAESSEQIEAYNVFAGQHEEIIAKALFSAGYTWPGIFVAEDRAALDVLCSRPDIDAGRVGCCGLSLGGLRTDYLAGLDDRIRCSVTAGFMTTWQDLILNNCYTHTWMVYVPLLSRYLGFPEVLGMRAPLPSMVLATDGDPLFDLGEVRRALGILEQVYARAGSPQSFSQGIYPGAHKFDRAMQERAFDWLDRHLRA
jgi:dienelactone hydrolase